MDINNRTVVDHVRDEFIKYHSSLNSVYGKNTLHSVLNIIANTMIDPRNVHDLTNLTLLPIEIVTLQKLALQYCSDAESFAIYAWQQIYNNSNDLQKQRSKSDFATDQNLEPIQRELLQLYRAALTKVMHESTYLKTKQYAQFLLAYSQLTDTLSATTRGNGKELMRKLLSKRDLDPKLQMTAENAIKIYDKNIEQTYAPRYAQEFVSTIIEIMTHEKSKPDLFDKINKLRRKYGDKFDNVDQFHEKMLTELLKLPEQSGWQKKIKMKLGMEPHAHTVSNVIYNALAHFDDIGADSNGLRILQRYLEEIRPKPSATAQIQSTPPQQS